MAIQDFFFIHFQLQSNGYIHKQSKLQFLLIKQGQMPSMFQGYTEA